MPSLKKSTLIVSITLIILTGCTQVVTVPVSIAGSVVGTTIDVTGSAINTVSRGDTD